MDVISCPKDQNHPFTQISNSFINDIRLSLKSKALLIFLISKPPSWCFNFNDILKFNSDGIEAIKTAIKELISLGYISKYQLHRPDGRFDYFIYRVYESPYFSSSTKTTSPPQVGFPLAVRPLAFRPLADNSLPAIKKDKIRLREETATSSTKVGNTTAVVHSPEYKKKYKVTYDFLKSLGVINQKSIIKKYGLDNVFKYSHAFKDSILKADSPTKLLVTSVRDKWEIIPLNVKKPKPFLHEDICISCHLRFYYLDFSHTHNICGICEKKGE